MKSLIVALGLPCTDGTVSYILWCT